MHLSLLIRLFLTGRQSAEGSGLGEDHDSSGQESEWGPKEETICGHCHTWGSKGAFFSLHMHTIFSLLCSGLRLTALWNIYRCKSPLVLFQAYCIIFVPVRSCCWMSLQQAWTPAPDTRCGHCWKAAEQAESLSSAHTTWMRLTYLLVQHTITRIAEKK